MFLYILTTFIYQDVILFSLKILYNDSSLYTNIIIISLNDECGEIM